MDPTLIPPIPPGGRLIHIGPHKTGTTSVQAALFLGRDDLRAQGILHAGRSRNPAAVIHQAIGVASDASGQGALGYGWSSLCREIRQSPLPRVVLSSEVFADAPAERIEELVADLGGEAVHLVVTLRSLTRILASQWQQYVQRGLRRDFDRWLHAVLVSGEQDASGFWWRHRHDELIARWARVVGPGKMTVVVADERDPAFVLRAVETLLGGRPGTLAVERDLANRSMTMPEIEAIRALNIAFRTARLPMDLHARIIRHGATAYMKLQEPSPDWPRIEVPQWALDRATEVAREMVANIRASGVRVIGDLDSLTVAAPSPLTGDTQPPVAIPPEVAASMAMGVLLASGLARQGAGGRLAVSDGRTFFEPPELARVPTYQLAGVVAIRGRAAVIRGTRRILRRDRA